jgi:hypothetical protein
MDVHFPVERTGICRRRLVTKVASPTAGDARTHAPTPIDTAASNQNAPCQHVFSCFILQTPNTSLRMRAAKPGAIVVLTRSLDICTVLRCPVLWLLPACPRDTSPFFSKRKRFLAPWWLLVPCFQRTHSVVGLSSAGGEHDDKRM